MLDNKFSCSFFCGTTRGFLASTTWYNGTTNNKVNYNIKQNRSELKSFEFGRSTDEIVIGTISGKVRLYNIVTDDYAYESLDIEGTGPVIGSGILQENILLARENGVVTVWNPESDSKSTFTLDMKESGGSKAMLRCMKRNEHRDNICAFAGENYQYTLWDVEQKKPIFIAKRLPLDQLYQLPQPTTARALCFLPHNPHVGAIVTAEGATLLYDERVARRPVLVMREDTANFSYTSVAATTEQHSCGGNVLLAGLARGGVHVLDVRGAQGRRVGVLKGFTGSVTGLAMISCAGGKGGGNVVVSTSLDRHLRVHCVDTTKILYQVYMKIGLQGVLVRPSILEPSVKEEVDDLKEENTPTTDLDGLFANMETINDDDSDQMTDDSPAKPSLAETTVSVPAKRKRNKRNITKKRKLTSDGIENDSVGTTQAEERVGQQTKHQKEAAQNKDVIRDENTEATSPKKRRKRKRKTVTKH